MGSIYTLSEHVANKIAAGEVVERPASVVKELVENSLDAGARSIAVTVKHGGKSFISVCDDGSGMDSEDAQACLQRHATSKIETIDDIETIATLGFRGEALPSIASVSRVAITTRTRDAQTATRVTVSGGAIDAVTECVAQPGTTVEVADLFFNIPARRKFLKSPAAEYNAIAEVMHNMALMCSSASFSLNHNGKETMRCSACEGLSERVAQLSGSGYARQMYALSVEHRDLSIDGLIGIPDNARVNRTGQKLFINGRHVHSPALSIALGRGYEEFLPHRRFPTAVLFLRMDPSWVDVNVHPAKREVRLKTERYVMEILTKAVRGTLTRSGIYPVQEPDRGGSQQNHYSDSSAAQGELTYAALREAAAQWNAGGVSSDSCCLKEESAAAERHVRQEALFCSGNEPQPFSRLQVVGQIFGTYIVAQSAEGVMLFDQHAAHERIVYEKLLCSSEDSPQRSQKLAFPVTIQLTAREEGVMESFQDELCRLGFGINPLGGRMYSIDAVPVSMGDVEADAVVKDALHEMLEQEETKPFAQRKKDLAAILACKTRSIKGGRELTHQEMERLLSMLAEAENPHTCPHGRPTYIVISCRELERKFHRA